MSTEYETKLPLEYFYQYEQSKTDDVFLIQPKGDELVKYTWNEVGDQARRMASYLISLDFAPGSHIALQSKNCAHWIMADLAIWMAGHVSVPLYPTLTPEIESYSLTHSESKLLFVGKLDGWNDMRSSVPEGLPCISFPYGTTDEFEVWDDIIANHGPLAASPTRSHDENATIIYTSGTTGTPKGVVQKFMSFAYAAHYSLEALSVPKDARFMSYLPLSHIAERHIVENTALASGGTIYFNDSLATFARDLAQAQANVFLGVPRIWTKLQMGVMATVAKGEHDEATILKGMGLGNLEVAISGAAPIPPSLIDWYGKYGVEIQEGYAMTENMAYSHFNRKGNVKVGTVGQPLPGVDAILGEADEILVKSHALMSEYYKEPEKTAETFHDGYLRTGDKGKIDEDGFLSITGRVKDLFKTEKGKYVAPAPIEMKFEASPFIEVCLLYGTNLPQTVLLICLSEIAAMKTPEEVEASLKAQLEQLNPSFEKHERIEKIIIVKEMWSVENKMLTPTMKVKRNVVEEAYAERIEAWYNEEGKLLRE